MEKEESKEIFKIDELNNKYFFAIKMSSKNENKSDLNYWIFNEDYPLHNCALGIICGSTNSGKSYFTYKYLLPAYIKNNAIKTILICSRTGRYDSTTSKELDNPIYKNIDIDFVKIEDSYKRCQIIRSNAIVNEYIEMFMNAKDEKEVENILKKLKGSIKSSSELDVIHDELLKFYNYVSEFISIGIDEVHEYSKLLWKSGSKITYNPTIIVFDDYASTSEFLKPTSNMHKLAYIRRHLHLGMFLLTQSIVAVSASIRRNASMFVLFSTLSEMDLKAIRDRLPIKWSYKQLLEKFMEISESENRDDKVITIFSFYPNQKVIQGTPTCLKELLK